MDQATSQLIANQLGLPSKDGQYEPNEIATALASRTSDPLMAALFQQLANRTPTSEIEEGITDDEAYEREIIRLKKVIARLQQRITSANVMAHYIADIFGACPTCWGLNRICERCQGKGLPGYTDPNLEELRAWVEP